MSAVKEHFMSRTDPVQDICRLSTLKGNLETAYTMASILRDKAIRDYTSDEPYENAMRLCGRIRTAIAEVEIMLEDLGVQV